MNIDPYPNSQTKGEGLNMSSRGGGRRLTRGFI